MSKPRPFVIANWKCNGTLESVTELTNAFNVAAINHDVDCAICPAALHIGLLQSTLRHPKFSIGAQNCYVKNGAFTGEVSIQMLLDAGIRQVILGHSERRGVFGETDEVIATKAAACVTAGMHVILCVGETREERDAGRGIEVVINQLNAVMAKVPQAAWDRGMITVAAEPRWAIGASVTPTPNEIQQMHGAIREWLSRISAGAARVTRILYGGSVTASNAAELYAPQDVNGFLVGGASLKPGFIEIINATGPRSSL